MRLLARLIDPTVARGVIPHADHRPRRLRWEHELLHFQLLFSLARELRDGEAQMGAIRLVPLPVSMAKIPSSRMTRPCPSSPPREILIKAFEVDYPGYGEMIKQAMEMRALVIVARVNEQADVNGLANRSWEPMIDELLASRLVVSCCATAEGGPTLTRSLVERSQCKQLSALSFVLNNVKIADKEGRRACSSGCGTGMTATGRSCAACTSRRARLRARRSPSCRSCS